MTKTAAKAATDAAAREALAEALTEASSEAPVKAAADHGAARPELAGKAERRVVDEALEKGGDFRMGVELAGLGSLGLQRPLVVHVRVHLDQLVLREGRGVEAGGDRRGDAGGRSSTEAAEQGAE